jgi:hypothetical protein
MAAAPVPQAASAAGHPWPSADILREHAPIVRLLSVIWTIPQVTKIGLSGGTHSIDLWVFTSEDSEETEAVISAAERTYRATACARGFMLHVIPDGAVPADALPPYDTLIER